MRNQEISAGSPRAVQPETRATEKKESSFGSKLKNIAKAFTKTMSLRDNKADYAKLSEAQSLGGTLESQPALDLFSDQATHSSGKHSLENLRARLFKQDHLSAGQQKKLATEIEARCKTLGTKGTAPYFEVSGKKFLDAKAFGKVVKKESESGKLSARHPHLQANLPEITQNQDTLAYSVKPSRVAQQVIADLYQEKYGIQIHVQQSKNHHSPEKLAELLMEKLEAANGEPIGLLLQRPRQYASRNGDLIPLVVQNKDGRMDLLNLGNTDGYVREYLKQTAGCLRQPGTFVTTMDLHNTGRRVKHSDAQDTDAMQILKDCLVENKTNTGHLVSRYQSQFDAPKRNQNDAVPRINFPTIFTPAHLLKTVQVSTSLVNAHVPTEQILDTRAPSLNPYKQQTIGQHRERYSLQTENGEGVNHFVTVKAFRNAFKVLDHLESFSNANERAQYLQTIAVKNGMD